MNSSVYVFGSLGNGYTQYPDDYAKDIFQNLYEKSAAHSQIAIRRDKNLMYYGYIRKLDVSGQYIGFCILLNGVMFMNVNSLFKLFEDAFADLINRGVIVNFNDKGEVTSSIINLYQKKNEVERIVAIILNNISDIKFGLRKLPPIFYEVSTNECIKFYANDDDSKIEAASCKFGYTFILKDSNYDTYSVCKIKQLSKTITDLEKGNNRLKNELSSTKRKQRNATWVSLLSFVVFVLVIILWDKVLFPTEVTKKEMGEYVYYGPMLNGEPNGIGVAIYHPNDSNNRLYYYGNFNNGLRQDTAAIMFYRDGSYFYGEMDENHWKRGEMYSRMKHEHFDGSFDNGDNPQTGAWYECNKVQLILYGKPIKIQ